jgi:hypothetical protein
VNGSDPHIASEFRTTQAPTLDRSGTYRKFFDSGGHILVASDLILGCFFFNSRCSQGRKPPRMVCIPPFLNSSLSLTLIDTLITQVGGEVVKAVENM